MEEAMTVEKLQKILSSPYYAITIHPTLFGEHTKMVTKEEWIKVQKQMIKEMGQDTYFENLLDCLENGLNTGDAPFGYLKKGNKEKNE